MLATTLLLAGVLLGSWPDDRWPDDRDAIPLYAFLALMMALFYVAHERLGMVILGLFMIATLAPRLVKNFRGLVRSHD
jgi:hypothetical protein